MKKILFLATAICLVFMTACTDSGKELESISTPEPPTVVTPTPEPTPTATPEPTPEPTPTIEMPPVPTVYNAKADLNNDGHVDKAEWEKWTKANPLDKNQDLVISEDEKAPAKPSGGNGNNTSKPSTPAPEKPSGGNTGSSTPTPPDSTGGSGGLSEDEQKAWDDLQQGYDDYDDSNDPSFEMPEGGIGGFDPVQ